MERLFSVADDRGLIGTVVAGSYRVTALLGAGAMGKVYRAEDVERGTPVALKVLHPFLSANKEAGARFRREAFVGVRLLHPNCVAVLDFGTAADGSFYLAMELLEGESLGDRLDREGAMPWPRALAIARHVLRGLDHAHRESVVHRDIKPDNVFLSDRDGDPDFARVLDFGIAKLVGDVAGQAITQAGISIGTPSYLSPEQAIGGALDGRSDLYSLSIVLYEMLAGRTPFGHLEPMKRLLAHVAEPVPALGDVAPGIDVPPEVEALVRDGLAKKPEERIASAAEYLARIDALLAPLAAVARPPERSVPAPAAAEPVAAPAVISTRPTRRSRARRALAAAALVVATASVAVASRSIGGDSPLLHRAEPVAAAERSPQPPPPMRAEVREAIELLENGKTCAARRRAVVRLKALGDPRAIPHLDKARSRPRRGKNSNACLKAVAASALEHLSAIEAPE